MLETCGLWRNSFVSSLPQPSDTRYPYSFQYSRTMPLSPSMTSSSPSTQTSNSLSLVMWFNLNNLEKVFVCYVMIKLFLVCDCLLHKHVVYIVRQHIIISISAFSLADPGGGGGLGIIRRPPLWPRNYDF